ncbi:MAG: SIR2 family protein, partial [Fusobacteriaceae bacterium]
MNLLSKLTNEKKINLVVGNFFHPESISRSALAKFFCGKIPENKRKNISNENSLEDVTQSYLDSAIGIKTNLLSDIQSKYDLISTRKTFYYEFFNLPMINSFISLSFDTFLYEDFKASANRLVYDDYESEKNIKFSMEQGRNFILTSAKIPLYKVFGDINSISKILLTSQDIRRYKILEDYKYYLKLLEREICTVPTVLLGNDIDNPDYLNFLSFIILQAPKNEVKEIFFLSNLEEFSSEAENFIKKFKVKVRDIESLRREISEQEKSEETNSENKNPEKLFIENKVEEILKIEEPKNLEIKNENISENNILEDENLGEEKKLSEEKISSENIFENKNLKESENILKEEIISNQNISEEKKSEDILSRETFYQKNSNFENLKVHDVLNIPTQEKSKISENIFEQKKSSPTIFPKISVKDENLSLYRKIFLNYPITDPINFEEMKANSNQLQLIALSDPEENIDSDKKLIIYMKNPFVELHLETAVEQRLRSIQLITNPISYSNIFLNEIFMKAIKIETSSIKVADEYVIGTKIKLVSDDNVKLLEIKTREFRIKFSVFISPTGNISKSGDYLEYEIFPHLNNTRFKNIVSLFENIFAGKII